MIVNNMTMDKNINVNSKSCRGSPWRVLKVKGLKKTLSTQRLAFIPLCSRQSNITSAGFEKSPRTFTRSNHFSSLFFLGVLISLNVLKTLIMIKLLWICCLRCNHIQRFAQWLVNLNPKFSVLLNHKTERLASMKFLVMQSRRHPHTKCLIYFRGSLLVYFSFWEIFLFNTQLYFNFKRENRMYEWMNRTNSKQTHTHHRHNNTNPSQRKIIWNLTVRLNWLEKNKLLCHGMFANMYTIFRRNTI